MKLKKILCPVMATMMLLSCTAGASASAADGSAKPDDEAEGIVYEVLGGIEDQDGILVDDMQSRADGLPFTMTAKRVTSLLTTYSSSGKSFTGKDLDANEGVLVEGTLTNTAGNDIKAGVCDYDDENDRFNAVYPHIFPSDEEDSTFIPKMNRNLY